MPSLEHEQIVAMMRGGLGLDQLSLAEQRELMEAAADMFPVEADVQVTAVDAMGVPADWVTTGESARTLLYFHGGAYVTGSRRSHRSLAARLARAAGARVLVPEYRLAPEHPFPAAVEDALTCWRFLLASGVTAGQIAVAGDSAGGGLALATLVALNHMGRALPGCGVGMSPWMDLDRSDPTLTDSAIDDPLLSLEGLAESAARYAPGQAKNPLVSPLFADLAGLPPVLLQTGTRDLLLSDSTRFAERAREAGVELSLEVEQGLIHVWHMYPDLPESQQSIARIGAFIRSHCG